MYINGFHPTIGHENQYCSKHYNINFKTPTLKNVL